MTGPNVCPSPAKTTTPSTHRPPAGSVFIFPEPVSYSLAWELQSRLHGERVVDCRPDTLLILEHLPVYTLGRRTQASHWGGDERALCADGIALYHVNRGGSVTYHAPGQVVAYPIVRLTQHATGPRQLVWLLEDVIIRLLSLWRIDGHRIDKKPGVWVMTPEPAKIAAIGIRIEHGVTLHGFALNVDMDLTPFQRIHPCGFTGCPVTSMATLLKTAVSVHDIKHELVRIFNIVLGVEWSVAKNDHDILLAAADVAGRMAHPSSNVSRAYAGT